MGEGVKRMETARLVLRPLIAGDEDALAEVYCDADNETLFRWSQAVTGVPGILSRNSADCR